MTNDENNKRPWKAELSKLLSEVTGHEVLDHAHRDHGRTIQPEGISIILEEPGFPKSLEDYMANVRQPVLRAEARKYLKELRSKLPPGFVAYIGTSRWLKKQTPGEKSSATQTEKGAVKPGFLKVANDSIRDQHERFGIEIAIGPGESQWDILRLAETSATNYGKDTEAVIESLIEIDKTLEIEIVEAETDSVAFEFAKFPEDKQAMLDELEELCPDVDNFGLGTVYFERCVDQRINLWWD